MRMLLVSCVFLLALAAARAEEMPNTLTPEQAAGGWKLLFDGANSEGLRTQGDVMVKDGILIVGDAQESRVGPKDAFPGDFEWRLEYQVIGPGPVSVRVELRSMFTSWVESYSLAQPDGSSEAWHVHRVIAWIDHSNEMYRLRLGKKVDGRDASTPGIDASMGGGSRSTAVELRIPPGTQIRMRNVTLKADPPSQSGLYWLYGLIGGLVAAVIALALFAYWRSTRRRALEN